MYLHSRIFLRALSLTVAKRRLTPRYLLWLLLIGGAFAFIWLLVAAGRALDHILFPGFRKREIREPIFIVAPPRSGTTYLQGLLALDTEQFCHVRLYETIFPSVTLLRLIRLAARVDRLAGRPAARLLGWCERRWFGGWDGLHTLRLCRPEEDEGYFVYTLVSEAIYMLFPFAAEIPEAAIADRLPERERRRLMAYYRSCLQRHLHAAGGDRILLTKNTLHCGRIGSLLDAFPDARVITITRDPRETIPSSVRLCFLAWKVHSPDIAADSPESRAYAEINAEYYRNLFRSRDRLRTRKAVHLSYPDLIADPAGTVERIYRQLGLVLSSASARRLQVAAEKGRSFRSGNRYCLEEFGLDERWIEERLGEVLAAERSAPAAATVAAPLAEPRGEAGAGSGT